MCCPITEPESPSTRREHDGKSVGIYMWVGVQNTGGTVNFYLVSEDEGRIESDDHSPWVSG